MKPLVPLTALLALAALALAGCSSGGPVTPVIDPANGHYVIHMTSGNTFSPATAKVPVGATVDFVNDGATPHDVHGDDGLNSGETGGLTASNPKYSHTFATAGTYAFHCEFHASSGMKGTLTVG